MKLSPRQLFVIVLFISIFALTLRPVVDPDFWWHLRTGQLMSETGAIPTQDPYSFTMKGQPWVAHEWLTELGLYFAYRLGGFNLLILLFSTIISLAYVFVYLRCPGASKPYVAGFVLILGAAASNPLWGVRPQMITLLFFSIFLFLLDRYQSTRRLRYLAPLPPMMVVWVNLHAGYFLGLGLIGIFIAGPAIDLIWNRVAKKEPLGEGVKQLVPLAACLALALGAAIVNPNGPRILLYPFETLFDPAMQMYIQEWQSPDFHIVSQIPFGLMLLALIITGMKGRHSSSTTNLILVLSFCLLALRSIRNIPLLAIIAVPVLSNQLSTFIAIWPSISQPSKLFKLVNWVLITMLVIGVAARFMQMSNEQRKAEVDIYPGEAVEWILKNRPVGEIYNTYGWGGYLIWRLYPEIPIFIDGRADVYGSSFMKNYFDIYLGNPGWKEGLQKAKVQIVLIEPGAALAKILRESPDWTLVYSDKLSVIYELRQTAAY